MKSRPALISLRTAKSCPSVLIVPFMSPPPEPDPAKDTSNQPPVKKRKRRSHLNCAECRRLKLKCDRTGKSRYVTEYRGMQLTVAQL
ncbi:uncharacterized protein L199_006903 [Kwoniella botswanensis]|uniref:uncharacterized protein n=1 Tax=Kwoniella botswanensis TaxID=1268659 RepID=UPI00315DA1F8